MHAYPGFAQIWHVQTVVFPDASGKIDVLLILDVMASEPKSRGPVVADERRVEGTRCGDVSGV